MSPAVPTSATLEFVPPRKQRRQANAAGAKQSTASGNNARNTPQPRASLVDLPVTQNTGASNTPSSPATGGTVQGELIVSP